ncbi:MAG: alanine racemase [Planctomycetota bacterium]
MQIDGHDVAELAKRFQTPLYVFSAETLRQRVAQVKDALGPRCELLWSVKANPSVAVTGCLRRAGVGAEIASSGELLVAIAAGHRPSELRFAGPGKSDPELADALARGLGTFHVESGSEVDALQRLAGTAGQTARVAIRVNLPQELSGSRMRMGGKSSRFGIDEEQVPAIVRAVTAAPNLELVGLHVYGGTQCFDAAAFVGQAEQLLVRADAWERELSVRFDELDIGGGFGTAIFDGDPEFDLAAAGEALQQLIAQHDRDGRRWFVELGRFLAAPAGVFVARVVRSKRSGGTRQLALDGGMHHAAAQAGFGTIVRRPPLAVAVHAPLARDVENTVCGGQLCTPADSFGRGLQLPKLDEGDLLALLHAGAYGLTYSPHSFLSQPTPAEVLIDGSEARIVRERGQPEDAVRGQSL